MGIIGAEKTTLLDVLFGRENSGIIEGDIRIGVFKYVNKLIIKFYAVKISI